jgi:signal transduction histidine kinase
MALWAKLKPDFWDRPDGQDWPFKHMFNFRRIWKRAVLLIAGVALVPLLSITAVDYNVTQKAIMSDVLLQTSRLVSNTKLSISFFLSGRAAALHFIVQDNGIAELQDPLRLEQILSHLKTAFGGFVDLGVVDAAGRQQHYAGPYELAGVNYSDQGWFQEVVARGVYVSDVFLGFRNVPHIIIAVKHRLPDNTFFILRAALDTARFNELIDNIAVSGEGDKFIINLTGRLQTPSISHGQVFEEVGLPVPPYVEKTQVVEGQDAGGEPAIIGYSYIPESPFILMIVKRKANVMRDWLHTRSQLIGFLVISISGILVVIVGVTTYLVNNLHLADQRRVTTLHQVEYANKLASIGRLSAGVAHEINNPLAIINEKAGLIKDIFSFKPEYAQDRKLIGLIDGVIASVERCAVITRRLLGFARHMAVSIEPIAVKTLIEDVLGFLRKEAEYRSIDVEVKVPEKIPTFVSDRGKLQQILLNLINNAFAALSDGGRLQVEARLAGSKAVAIDVIDNGSGIAPGDLDRIFEPFFSTRTCSGGTGLGLSITYGLVQELGGTLTVASRVGEGSTFTVTLPLEMPQPKGDASANPAGR